MLRRILRENISRPEYDYRPLLILRPAATALIGLIRLPQYNIRYDAALAASGAPRLAITLSPATINITHRYAPQPPRAGHRRYVTADSDIYIVTNTLG